MCDYCSCRSMPLIEDLGEEHEALAALASEVRRAIRSSDPATAHDRFASLLELLGVHDAAEEAGVFAALRAAGELDDQVDALLAEHAAAWATVPEDGSEAWNQQALAFLTDLEDHIAREEYDLFPATLVAIPADGWDTAETAAAAVRNEAAAAPAR